MSVAPIDILLSALPPLFVLVLMVGFNWGGSKAGPAGWFVALLIALLRFGATLEVIGYAQVSSFALTFDVVYIVWSALLLYHVVEQAGGMGSIARWFTALTRDDVLRVLLVGWVFASFLQGVGGFGLPVAVVSPLLLGLGLTPLVAVLVPSVAHGWAVTFGSLSSSFIALVGVTGMDPAVLAPPSAVLLGAGGFACGLLAAYAYAGWRGVRRGLPAVLVLGAVMAVIQYMLASRNLYSIAAVLAALAGLIVGLWVTRWPFYRRAAEITPEAAPANPSAAAPRNGRPMPPFALAISGYVILVVLAIVMKGIPAVGDFLARFLVMTPVPEVTTTLGWVTPAAPDLSLDIVGHTGSVLLYTSVIIHVIFRIKGFYRPGDTGIIVRDTIKGSISPALGVISMVGMATIMSNVGMTRALAEWLSQAVPPGLYAFVSTLIGAIGAFMTGSNTNSNTVFGGLQMETAALLGLNVALVLGIQTTAAGIASVLAPAKIIVGASTVGLSGQEGLIMRKLLIYTVVLLLFVAVLGAALLRVI